MSDNFTINILISSPPFGRIDGKEGIDLALVCAAFEQRVNLIFIDEGIFHLMAQQNGDHFLDKSHDKQLKALAFYDIDTVYFEAESLQSFALTREHLLTESQMINRDKINEWVAIAPQTVTF